MAVKNLSTFGHLLETLNERTKILAFEQFLFIRKNQRQRNTHKHLVPFIEKAVPDTEDGLQQASFWIYLGTKVFDIKKIQFQIRINEKFIFNIIKVSHHSNIFPTED